MKTLKLAAISVIAFLSANALAQGTDQQALQKALSPWNPTEISSDNHHLVIVLPGNSITTEAYEAVIMNGICSPLWTKSLPKSALQKTQLLTIVNQHKVQGFSFESPSSTCEEMGKLMDQPAKVMLSSKTHLFSANSK